MVSHTLNPFQLMQLFNNTYIWKNMLSCNELQMVIATPEPNYKASSKSSHFLIM